MLETLKLANSPVLWILSLLLVSVVVIQSFLFYKISKAYSISSNLMNKEEIKKSLIIGMTSTIGPSIAVFAVAIALIASVGAPLTLARVGVIGSAPYELIVANIGSNGTVGTEDFNKVLYTTAVWVMTIGGSGWLVSSLLMTKKLELIQVKLKSKNKLTIPYLATLTPLAIFLVLAYNQYDSGVKKGSFAPLFAIITGGIIMHFLTEISKKRKNLEWIKNWSMAFTVLSAMFIGNLFN